MPSDKNCEICDSTEPFHVHDTIDYTRLGTPIIMDYFTVGRGLTDIASASEWKRRALSAERVLQNLVDLKMLKEEYPIGYAKLGDTKEAAWEKAKEVLQARYIGTPIPNKEK